MKYAFFIGFFPSSGCVGTILLRVGWEEVGGTTGSTVTHMDEGYCFLFQGLSYTLVARSVQVAKYLKYPEQICSIYGPMLTELSGASFRQSLAVSFFAKYLLSSQDIS